MSRYRRNPKQRRGYWVQGIATRRGWNDYANNVNTALKVAGSAMRGVKMLTGLINVEFKHIDKAGSLNPGTSGAITALSQVAQGDGVQNREGNQIELKSLRTKFYIQKNASAVTTIVRIIWFIDNKSVSGSTPAVTDVLETATPQSMPNFNNRRRFTFLFDRSYNLGDITMTHSEIYKEVNMKSTYDDTTATSGNDNQLYMLYLSNEPTNTPTLLYTSRVRYIDN